MLSRNLYAVLYVWTVCFWTAICDCQFPKKTIPNGRYLYEAPRHANLTVASENYLLRFRCSKGFTLVGSRSILCLSNKWSSKLPSCIKMRCGDPPPVPNAQFSVNKGVSEHLFIGTTVTYSCDPGFELVNETESLITCYLFEDINDAQWKGALPECRKKETCLNPGVSADGRREGDCCFVGNRLRFSCNEDFDLVGEEEIECLPGGKWNASRPLCRPQGDHCDLPQRIPHGAIRGSKEGDYYLPDDEVEVLCEPGFLYTGTTEFIMCEEEIGWEMEFEECIESVCDIPAPLTNGTMPEIENSNMTAFPFNFELTYLCDKGFRLIGDSWRFCDSKGWSGKNPHCSEIHCPDPGVPEHGIRSGSIFEIGQKVVFSCFTGYELIGSFERYCMPNGQWSGELSRCDHPNNYCPNPGTPVNGMKNSSDYEMGDHVLFRCHSGYTLVGSQVRECLPSKEWSGDDVQCMGPYDFDNSAQIGEILKAAIAEKEAEQNRKLKEYEDAHKASWHNGATGRLLDLNFPGRLIFYFAFDVSGSVREHNFRKSVNFAKAIVKRVGITPNGARAGALTFSSKADTSFLPLLYQSTEEVLAALDRLNYTGGGTSANSALSSIREELIPLTKAVLGEEGAKSIKSIIFILTDGKANMGGDPQEQAQLLKAAGVEIYCIGITNNIVQDSLHKIAGGQDGQHVFTLQDYATMSYLIEEITNGSIDYSKCGLGLEKLGKQASRGRIVGGRQAAEPWPWMAALYVVKGPGTATLQCGGSIIHDSYILTAAHCMFRKNSTMLKERDIIVKLGLINVKNQTSMEEFEVKTIIMHPLYGRGVVYDYDIALLQLKRPISFTKLIRPICLPAAELVPNSTLYKPGQLTVATGWGHTGIVQKQQQVDAKTVENLKEVIQPIQSTDRCLQSLLDHDAEANAFTERMFCVGDGKGDNDTCSGDSGGPLMQSQSNEEGTTFWTQVGIVSWGIGCGLENTYGYYTHVQRLYSWMVSVLPRSKERLGPE